MSEIKQNITNELSEEELENNLGVIAESGSLKFKEENKEQRDRYLDIINKF